MWLKGTRVVFFFTKAAPESERLRGGLRQTCILSRQRPGVSCPEGDTKES